MTQRQAPATGYNFSSKRQYRRDVWSVFRKYCVGRLADATALLMPSIEGDEIEVALNNGFRERNLHIVDRNPAIVATLKRRYGNINTYGVDVVTAAQRIAKECSLDVANLDMCANVCERLTATLHGVALTGVLDCSLTSVTILRGRETADTMKALRVMQPGHLNHSFLQALSSKELTHVDHARVAKMGQALASGAMSSSGDNTLIVSPIRANAYKSTAGTQTMLWTVFAIASHDQWMFRTPMSREDLLTPRSKAILQEVRANKHLVAEIIGKPEEQRW